MKLKSSTAIGTWLRLARDKLGISRKTLAIAAGLSTSTLRNAETSRHKITRHTAALLLQEIAKRDAALANSAPDSLLDTVRPRSKRPSKARPAVFTELPPLAYLRLHPASPRARLLLELDQQAARKLVSALKDLLAWSQQSPKADLPELRLVLVEEQ